MAYVRRVLAAGASAAITATVLAGTPLALASPATASVNPTVTATAAHIDCHDPRVYNTVGRVTCKGTGLFRAKGNCTQQLDAYSNWVRIKDSEATAYVECKHKIRSVSAETRPGA